MVLQNQMSPWRLHKGENSKENIPSIINKPNPTHTVYFQFIIFFFPRLCACVSLNKNENTKIFGQLKFLLIDGSSCTKLAPITHSTTHLCWSSEERRGGKDGNPPTPELLATPIRDASPGKWKASFPNNVRASSIIVCQKGVKGQEKIRQDIGSSRKKVFGNPAWSWESLLSCLVHSEALTYIFSRAQSRTHTPPFSRAAFTRRIKNKNNRAAFVLDSIVSVCHPSCW